MELPTEVLAYRLFESVDITKDKQQLARATMASFSSDSMKKQVTVIYAVLVRKVLQHQ